MEKSFQYVEQELQRVPQELHGIPTKNSNQIVREVGNETNKCDVQVHGVSPSVRVPFDNYYYTHP